MLLRHPTSLPPISPTDVFRAIVGAVLVCDEKGMVFEVNEGASGLFEWQEEELVGSEISRVFVGQPTFSEVREATARRGELVRFPDAACRTKSGHVVPVTLSAVGLDRGGILTIWGDIRKEKRLEGELAQAQKLEAIGQLAAGVAHEMNTPIQFVGDSLDFVREGVADLLKVIDGKLTAAAADLDYLRENLPRAVERSQNGIGRVAEIVRALKEFSHPRHENKEPADVNHAIEQTLIVARSEFKYVADVELALADIPMVVCHIGELNQVLINLIVNAAHAIADAKADGHERAGKIRIGTRLDGDDVVVSVADNGTGIALEAQGRIFEPFFTTKEVGRGTGQGLAIAHNIVVGRHGGAIEFETEPGKGTRFDVRLPVQPRDAAEERLAS